MDLTDIGDVVANNAVFGLEITTDVSFYATHLSPRDWHVEAVRTVHGGAQPIGSIYENYRRIVLKQFDDFIGKCGDRWLWQVVNMASLHGMPAQLHHAVGAVCCHITNQHHATVGVANPTPYIRPISDVMRRVPVPNLTVAMSEPVIAAAMAGRTMRRWLSNISRQYWRMYLALTRMEADAFMEQCHEVRQALDVLEKEAAHEAPTNEARERQLTAAVTQSARLFAGLHGQERLDGMMAEDANCVFHGTRYDYELSNRTSLTDQMRNLGAQTMPFSLAVRAKDGALLFQGCVYFPHTPLLDQAAAIGLYVSHPSTEIELLTVMHGKYFTHRYYQDDFLVRLKGVRMLKHDPATFVERLFRYDDATVATRPSVEDWWVPLYHDVNKVVLREAGIPSEAVSMMRKRAYHPLDIMMAEGEALASVPATLAAVAALPTPEGLRRS